MSKPAMLSDDAYELLKENQRNKESLSDVIKRYVPPPIRTFGDLEKHLANIEGPVAGVDYDALAALKKRKRKANRAH
ncbi:MAG TPA: antitoxin VapB family protein [Verrucomicrobiae bacterium]|jgi:predicted CopG family antitoxin|nr:antitoxin VapB family protein [Verrucomicrobiae bacterium]